MDRKGVGPLCHCKGANAGARRSPFAECYHRDRKTLARWDAAPLGIPTGP